MMDQLAVTVLCPSSLKALTSPVLLKQTEYTTFFIAHFCITVSLRVIYKEPYHTFLMCWNSKKWYACSIISYDLEIRQRPLSLSSFKVSLEILTHSGFCCSVKSWGTQRQTNFSICSSSTHNFIYSCRSNVNFFPYHLAGTVVIIN